jgi:hypothetical protein
LPNAVARSARCDCPAVSVRREMIQITAVRLTGGIGHEHITDLMWCGEATPAGLTSRQGLVDWVSAASSNRAVILAGPREVQVDVVRPASEAPYLRARTDGIWTDDLLALPRF